MPIPAPHEVAPHQGATGGVHQPRPAWWWRLGPEGFRQGLARRDALRHALVLLVAVAVTYAVAILLLGIGGGSPGTAPWLTIPRSSYFLVESTFTAPVVVLSAILAAAVAYLTIRLRGVLVAFDDVVVCVARATSLALCASLVPDFVMGALTATGIADGAAWADALLRPTPARTFLWSYLALYVVAFLVLYPAAVRAAAGVRLRWAICVGWLAFAVFQTPMFVFIR